MLLLIARNFWTLLTVVNVANCAAARRVLLITGKTRRRIADIQQDVLHNGLVGSRTCPLQISAAPIAGHGMSLDDMHAYADCSTELASLVSALTSCVIH